MAEIILDNQSVKFDDCLLGLFLSVKWNLLKGRGKPYVRHSRYSPQDKKVHDIFMHHMVIGRPLNRMVVDHINGDTLDNRKENLRIVTHRENSCRTDRIKSGLRTSKYMGVSKSKNRWISVIQINGVLKYLGSFNLEKDAASAYQNAKEAI